MVTEQQKGRCHTVVDVQRRFEGHHPQRARRLRDSSQAAGEALPYRNVMFDASI